MNRREFLKSFAVIGAAAALPLSVLNKMTHPGHCYCVIEEYPLGMLGRMPEFQFEIDYGGGLALTQGTWIWAGDKFVVTHTESLGDLASRIWYTYNTSGVLWLGDEVKHVERVWADGMSLAPEQLDHIKFHNAMPWLNPL